ncbi:hypothetical protein Glove_440g18 [Diversispora epigaea]|uniref:Uncharacterized protein n=1 Tax=Diversispora epigaea TaxID=1348612 RepID=A0A397GRI9_9GLOM|nr:hypothetical protein Glove_440g18 [Diversispora epigaea]
MTSDYHQFLSTNSASPEQEHLQNDFEGKRKISNENPPIDEHLQNRLMLWKNNFRITKTLNNVLIDYINGTLDIFLWSPC